MARRDLAQRHVVVTGAGTGIGRAIALRLARRGARLSLLARRRRPLVQTAEACAEAGAAATLVRSLDIREAARVERAFRAAVKDQGPVWALVANSGIGGPNQAGPDDRFEDLVATNLTGTYHCLRAAEAHLADGPRAPAPGCDFLDPGAHRRSGVQRLLRLQGRALGADALPGHGARAPGRPGQRRVPRLGGHRDGLGGHRRHGPKPWACPRDEAFQTAMADVPLGRMGRPEDVAGLVSWLLSDDARGVTGQGLDMNNGAFMA